MSWQQARPFNQSKGGKRKGWCLQNVRLGFAIATKYPTAIEAWKHTQQHKTRNVPAGVAVPLFYSYKSAGHINVRLKNGNVWSDGDLYSSIADYERNHTPKYLGWGESINGVRVIEYVKEPTVSVNYKKITPQKYELKRDASLWNFDFASWQDAKAVVTRKKGFVFTAVAIAENSLGGKYYMTGYAYNGGKVKRTQGFNIADCEPYKPAPAEHDGCQAKIDAQTETIKQLTAKLGEKDKQLDAYADDLADLKKTAQTLTTRNGELGKVVNNLTKENKRLQAQITAVNRDTNQLNSLGVLLRWFIQRLGIK